MLRLLAIEVNVHNSYNDNVSKNVHKNNKQIIRPGREPSQCSVGHTWKRTISVPIPGREPSQYLVGHNWKRTISVLSGSHLEENHISAHTWKRTISVF